MEGDVVAQFSEITGANPELATQYLQLTEFNIEQAMQLYFENDGQPLTQPAVSSSTANRPSNSAGYEDESGVVHLDSDDDEAQHTPRNGPLNTATFEDDAAMARRLQEEMYGGQQQGADDDVRAPMARTTETLVGPEADFGGDMHESILGQLRARQRRGDRPGIFNQQDTTSIWTGGEEDDEQHDRLSAATGGASDRSAKSNLLAELYRPPFEIMSKLPWDLAREEGREHEKWLLINIQDPSVFDCQVLNRDLWKNAGIKETIQEHFIFLQYNKDDPRAAPYIQYYFQNSDVSDNYPNIAIVDPRTGEQMKVWSGPPVMKAADFLMQLHEFLDRYSLKHNVRNPVAKRKPEVKEKRIDAMTEEEMMELAMKNSLGAEAAQAKKMEDPDDLTRSFGDIKGKGKAVDEEDVDMDEPGGAANAEASAFSSIPADRPHTEPAADPSTITRIQFRHPTGRIIRRFALADPVRRIYEWLKAEPALPDKAGVEFELNAMGRNLIDVLDETVEAAGLKNGTVMIGFIED
ncbi:DNA-protein crosslink repair co-factor UBX5 [Aspergillus stella-maris]|uniref:DNA-protein crosslink repair co-factor UBX5 n=1 Tax=Aspergillus stella-maris TaxID=1810926 RepID=UPI003CCDB1ED